MGKNKERQRKQSQVPTVPLDYERLAKCIAKAIAEENDKRANVHSVTREWMKFIISPIFWLIIILTAVLSVAFFIAAFNTLNTINATTILQSMVSFMLALIFLSIAIMAFFADREFEKEKDKHFVVSVFSGMISLVALIVALVALFMGVR